MTNKKCVMCGAIATVRRAEPWPAQYPFAKECQEGENLLCYCDKHKSPTDVPLEGKEP